jgi:hypothetical protein
MNLTLLEDDMKKSFQKTRLLENPGVEFFPRIFSCSRYGLFQRQKHREEMGFPETRTQIPWTQLIERRQDF